MGLLAGARSAARPGSSVSSVTKRCRLCSATKRSWNSCWRFLVLISLNLRMDGRQSCSLDPTETSLDEHNITYTINTNSLANEDIPA